MLRNFSVNHFGDINIFLNEVLSLNAQESLTFRRFPNDGGILNEVLSLNAQEFDTILIGSDTLLILNEVLSLNAQEFFIKPLLDKIMFSSMKS